MKTPPVALRNLATVQERKDPAPGYLEGSNGVLESQKVSQVTSLAELLESVSEGFHEALKWVGKLLVENGFVFTSFFSVIAANTNVRPSTPE